MLAAIERIESYTDGLTEDDFMNNFMIQDAVMRNLQIIGDASKKITSVLKETHSVIPWKEIAGMRNKLTHEYFSVDLGLVWGVINYNIVQLKVELQKILN